MRYCAFPVVFLCSLLIGCSSGAREEHTPDGGDTKGRSALRHLKLAVEAALEEFPSAFERTPGKPPENPWEWRSDAARASLLNILGFKERGLQGSGVLPDLADVLSLGAKHEVFSPRELAEKFEDKQDCLTFILLSCSAYDGMHGNLAPMARDLLQSRLGDSRSMGEDLNLSASETRLLAASLQVLAAHGSKESALPLALRVVNAFPDTNTNRYVREAGLRAVEVLSEKAE